MKEVRTVAVTFGAGTCHRCPHVVHEPGNGAITVSDALSTSPVCSNLHDNKNRMAPYEGMPVGQEVDTETDG